MEQSKIQKENLSISEAVLSTAKENLNSTAITYFGRKISYKTLFKKVRQLSLSLYSLGVKKGEVVLVALPNIPQSVYVLYALNRIGAVPAFVSPLSAEYELEDCINKCRSEVIIAQDIMYEKLIKVFERIGKRKLVLTSAFDELGVFIKSKKENAVLWSDLLKLKTKVRLYLTPQKPQDTAVILFSGGTTGKPKAVELSNLNLNALANGTEAVCEENVRGVKMLSVLPVFHGFGLGICIHTVLYFGGECILVPRFDAQKTGKIIRKHKPHYLAVVPAMLSPLMNSKPLAKADLRGLKGVFSGGDSLSAELQDAFNNFLLKHNAQIKIRQGYGLTECVAASCLMPVGKIKKNSIGKPYPHTLYKIVKINTLEEAEKGTEGEICISGKTVMKGYFYDEAETQNALKIHCDGRLWLHTGDMGCIDEDGYVYFKGRLKRIIVSNGYNVYPSELENALVKHKDVKECCAVGVKDTKKSERAVMFAVLNSIAEKTGEKQAQLLKYMESYMSKQAMPKCIYFLEKIPRTALGKISYAELEHLAEKLENEDESL